MISVSEALERILKHANATEAELAPLQHASRRVLAEDVVATRDQPPWNTSAMDGYAVLNRGVAPGSQFSVVGEVPAGQEFHRAVQPGEAVRIFTGARVPEGANRIIIQEDVIAKGQSVILRDDIDSSLYVRSSGGDFKTGFRVRAPRLLTPALLSLIASMNHREVSVHRRPVVSIVPSGDELAMPGVPLGDQRVIASNGFGLKALLEQHGAEVRLLPIARDNLDSLTAVLSLALDSNLVVTVGGASVGDYDLVRTAAEQMGMSTFFSSVAMRPGKPLTAGLLGNIPLIALPGNPVSSLVCGNVFLVPAVRAMQNLDRGPLPRRKMALASGIGGNGPREHYMRAVSEHSLGERRLRVFRRQDSSLISVLAEADALVVRPPNDSPRKVGELVDCICLDGTLDTKHEQL